jgi:undecaprenyl-diphosphatase
MVGHRIHALNPVMHAFSIVGRGGMIWFAFGLLFFFRGIITRAHLAALALAVVAAIGLADYAVKPMVDRPRPFVADPGARVIGGKPDDASFPSSHSANAFAAAYVLSRALPSARLAWLILAALIAVSRVYLGVHYPLDVGVGALIGLACGALAWTLVSRLLRSPRAQRRAAP